MSTSVRSASSFLLRLVGCAVALGGVVLGAAALMVDADASIQVLMGVIALGGLLIALVGGAFLALGALLGRGKAATAKPALSPEQQQLRDSREFLAQQGDEVERD